MVKLSEHFDDFTRQSRVMPVIVVSIPLFFAALAKGLSFSGWVETGSIVTRKGVEERSYSYGKTLLESCERI